MCGANTAAINHYLQLATAAIAGLRDPGLVERLRADVVRATELKKAGYWERAEDLGSDTYVAAGRALRAQEKADRGAAEADELIADVERELDEPVAQAEATVHAEVEETPAKAKPRRTLVH